MADVLSLLASEASSLVEPLTRCATTDAGRRQLFAVVGWDLDALPGFPVDQLVTEAGAIADAATKLAQLSSTPPADFEELTSIISHIGNLFDAVRRLDKLAPPSSGQIPQTVLDALSSIGHDLVEFVVAEYLLRNHPLAFQVARGLTLLQAPADLGVDFTRPVGGNGGPLYRRPALQSRFALDRLGLMLRNPVDALRADYLGSEGLSTVASTRLAAAKIFGRLGGLLAVVGASVSNGADQPGADQRDPSRTIDFHFGLPGSPPARLGALMQLVSVEEGAAGLLITPTNWASVSWEGRSWALTLAATAQLGTFRLHDGRVELPTGTDSVALTIDLERFPASHGEPKAIGVPGGTRLELGNVQVSGTFDLSSANFDVELGIKLSQCAVAFAANDGDGFLATALPKQPVRAPFDLSLRWSRKHGLAFEGGAALELTLPVNAAIGPLTVQSLFVGITADDKAPSARAGASIGFVLGPFAAAVARAGLQATLTFPLKGGNLGPIEAELSFKPPDGLGLAIDSPAVRGGGFLSFDADAGRYAGVFELTLVNTVSVKAIAIITTKNPDGTPGFALLIIITAEGFTPVPLGFGFALTGIGGLLALNRTVNADAVRNGLRDGVVDSVLFPKDPVKNATRLISTLDRIFPLAHDRLVIGPLAEIGWGSPPIVKVRLALLLEIPKPIRAILLATLSALLPNEKAAVVELHVDAIGVLDLGRGELSLDASLHDSRILQATLSGDMALRLNWGDAPTFLLSVGGFHPRYVPPAGLRPLNRLSLSLSSGNPSVRLECYFAITSNSVQFGARLTLSAQIAGFGVDGGGAFDALIQWSPFALDVSLQAWVRITAGGSTLLAATISAEVSGPQPWHVNGTASVSVLFFSVSVHIEFTTGAAGVPPPADTVDVAQAIWAEIGQVSAWQAALPPAVGSGATIAAPSGAPADAVLIHPLATVSLRQKVAPLDVPVSRMGARVPRAGTQSYHVDVSAPSGVSSTSLSGLFARAQFQDVADDAKLTGASFEPFAAGVTLTPTDATQTAQNGVVATDLTFETLDITSFAAPATSAGSAPALATALTLTHDMPAARAAGATVQVPSP